MSPLYLKLEQLTVQISSIQIGTLAKARPSG